MKTQRVCACARARVCSITSGSMTPRTPLLLQRPPLSLSLSARRGTAGKEVISVLRSSSALSEDILLLPTLKFQGFFCFSFPLLLLVFFSPTGSVYFCASLRVFSCSRPRARVCVRVCVELRIISGISIHSYFGDYFPSTELLTLSRTFERPPPDT